MRIAIFGATSQIAKDFILACAQFSDNEIVLFSRKTKYLCNWLEQNGLASIYSARDYAELQTGSPYEAILNFVGVGDPARALEMGSTIFEVTAQYDQLTLHYLDQHPQCRYIFMSSGAAYLSDFKAPADNNTLASLQINQIHQNDWYGISKMHAETRHRSSSQLPIVDIRIFNYFSHTQDINAAYFITQIARAISTNTILVTSPDPMVRDYLHPLDFYQLVSKILKSPAVNCAVDSYSKGPIDKTELLQAMASAFDLKYQIQANAVHANATGIKPFYYSVDRLATRFGYEPQFSSLEGLKREFSLLLGKS